MQNLKNHSPGLWSGMNVHDGFSLPLRESKVKLPVYEPQWPLVNVVSSVRRLITGFVRHRRAP